MKTLPSQSRAVIAVCAMCVAVSVLGAEPADTDNTLWNQPEAAGLNAVAEGFRHLGFKDDHELIAAESIVYDALYGYCREMVRRGKPNGQFA